MTKGNIRHMFPGGNTPRGFYSYYDYILPQKSAERILILKGGPGVGKSTFMKKIGFEMHKTGYDVEFMHCSSDPNSLDGVVIPKIKTAIIDGTKPHIVDPKNPGAVDEIINLGVYWDEKGLRKNKEAIIKIGDEISENFTRAYRYLKAASLFYDDMIQIYKEAVNMQQTNIVAEKLVNKLFDDIPLADVSGKVRKLFATAITPFGLKNYLSSIISKNSVIILKGQNGTGTENILERIKASALIRGLDVECYYCPMSPEKLEHIIIPKINVAITTSNEYHVCNAETDDVFNLDEFLDGSIIRKHNEILAYDKEQLSNLINKAITTIKKSKDLHDELENYYIPNMNFEDIKECQIVTMSRISKL